MACVLLALFVHAFVVSATHCHRFERPGSASAPAGVSVSDRGDAGRAVEQDADTQCLLCRLQRGFTFDLDSAPLLASPAARPTPTLERLSELPPATRTPGAPSGRAPPSA